MFDPSQIPWHTAFWASDRNWAPPADGAATASWRDFSGNGRTVSQATGSKQPTYHATDLGGKPCVTFDGVDDFMQTAAFTGLASGALVVVQQFLATPGAGSKQVTDGIASGNRWIAGELTTGQYGIFSGTTEIKAGTPDTSAHILRGNFAASTAADQLILDGTTIVNADTGSVSLTGLTLGSRFDGTVNFPNVRLAFVGLLDRALTTAEAIGIDSWARDFYGITVNDYQAVGRLARARRFKRV